MGEKRGSLGTNEKGSGSRKVLVPVGGDESTLNGGTLNTTTTTAWSQREVTQCRKKRCIISLDCPVGAFAFRYM